MAASPTTLPFPYYRSNTTCSRYCSHSLTNTFADGRRGNLRIYVATPLHLRKPRTHILANPLPTCQPQKCLNSTPKTKHQAVPLGDPTNVRRYEIAYTMRHGPHNHRKPI
ncbi:hypothetical protein LOAG_05918 [Loa loa]|uniref:Uncharacterized protein n=1 Tax=Loa loa TaxID=7209 RepID=A0A1S0TZ86_LOALO|nr:hypothetical protein LOAG_05918 [Loa loa]EFO22567.1 hypothetical protein LOAG_05918 [Loa loa]